MFKRLGLLLGAATLAASVGCISDCKYGCETTTLVAPGSEEGEIIKTHGAPDQVIEVGNALNANTKHWNKYLIVYRIGEGHMLLRTITQGDSFNNLCYLVEGGKVVNGGYVSEGSGKTILYGLSSAPHWKARVGYGGDNAWGGSYGGSGRVTGNGGVGVAAAPGSAAYNAQSAGNAGNTAKFGYQMAQ